MVDKCLTRDGTHVAHARQRSRNVSLTCACHAFRLSFTVASIHLIVACSHVHTSTRARTKRVDAKQLNQLPRQKETEAMHGPRRDAQRA